MWKNSICLALLITINQVWAQQSNNNFKYESAHNLILNTHLSLDWYGDVFFYRWDTGNGTAIYRGDAKKKKSPELIFEEQDVRETLIRSGYEVADDWKIYGFEANEKSTTIRFRFDGKKMDFDWKKRRLREATEDEPNAPRKSQWSVQSSWKKFNADSSAYIFARGHQLYIHRASTGEEIQLSTDGNLHYSFNISGNRPVDSLKSNSTNANWAGRYIVSWREDKRQVEDMSVLINLHQPRPILRTYKFPIPGDTAITKFKVEIWDSETLEKKDVDIVTEEDQRLILPGQLVNGRTYLHAPRLGSHEAFVYFLRRNRQNNRVELCRLDFAAAKVKVLIDEVTDPHINEQLFSVHILPETGDVLFWSERTGYGQFHRYDQDGNRLNRVGPKGDYVVGGIHYLDTASRAVFLEVYGFQKDSNPYYKQYLRCDLDSEYGKLITIEPYHHQIKLSDNKKYFLGQSSAIDQPGRYVLRDTTGRLLMSLGQADPSRLKDAGWRAPEKVEVLAADQHTKLYGLLYKPADFDASAVYPVIASVYPGPQDDFVPRGFTVDDNYHQSLADLGYVVVQVPSRGSSPLRGLRFHSHSYGNMRDYALEDNKLAIETLAKDRPYMDLNRVGIFGHSGGGFMSATALLTYPDFYKVAVAASGNYDPNIYTQWWGETYHGVSPNGKPGYIPTTLELASNLKGKLLLITGDIDVNVHPAQTFRLAEALIKADKYFDMMVLPGKDHGLGDKYYQNLIRNYFLLHLNNNNDQEVQK
ncbi:S9 family peptidase [Sphingobacterium chuzhouense]|uniref:Prolyl oligopeptidase family serine peptidase n=1 Tax=Sphingobacterium chuzhouense TaxID=1742264 RepID=A0ABR7XPY7_9SPHI|nr:prolyl oligopeptidase family serine peptidase [Sphingobacterium chuzhouense]MBD1421203.1 prolyl oligopeptidase family serine peptidase [Sphingobacterium chuzhouense]